MFSVFGTSVWNSLPYHLRLRDSTLSLDVFRRYLKSHLSYLHVANFQRRHSALQTLRLFALYNFFTVDIVVEIPYLHTLRNSRYSNVHRE